MMRPLAPVIVLLLLASGLASAKPEQDYPVSELYVMAAESARIDGERLVLSGLDQSVIWFTDRPVRRSGRASTEVFIANWPVGDDSFAVDPPNAVLVGGNDVSGEVELPMELMDPEWVEDTLVLRIAGIGTPLPETLSITSVHLFIDNQAQPGDGPVQAWCGGECFLVYWPLEARGFAEAD